MKSRARLGTIALGAVIAALVQTGVAAAQGGGSDPVLLAAGDIADCGVTEDEATAAILDANPGATVATLGDNVYENGTAQEFTNCYQPNWGRHKARTRPSAGNHEYQTAGASGYFGYFGEAAGDPREGWYSYDLGAWHVVALNSNCSEVGGCAAGSAQERWLRADLATHPARCTLAYWHHPRFASDLDTSSMQAIWQALYDFGADVVLSGHQHNYERFALLGPTGAVDANGIREFIVGTGGKDLAALGSPATGSQVRDDDTFGVLKLTLHPLSYEWRFLPIAGQSFTDSGAEACRPADPDATPPTQPTGLTATAASGRVDLAWQASSDNVGLAGYDILRDGNFLATVGTVTSYADTSVAPNTTYTYRVRARDLAGNVSDLSDPASATTPAAPLVQTFGASADARVQEASASTNYGSATVLGTDAGPAVESYLRFDVTGVSGTVQSARLRVWTTNGSVDGPAVYKTSTAWLETGLTWANRPARTSPATDDRGAVGRGVWVEFDVTSLVTGSGPVSFVLAQTGTDGVDFSSREATANRPELVVTVAPGDPPPPDATPPTQPTGLTATAASGRVDLAWQAASDNIGVTGYDIFRDGALLAQVGAVTSYADTAAAPATTYTYRVRARDAAGNVSPLSDPASATTPAPQSMLTFAPSADARVQAANVNTNYGSATLLGTDAGPAVETYIRFDLTGLNGTVESARLRLYATNGSVDGPAVYATASSFSESTLTWANRPARTGPGLDDKGAVATGAWVEFDVTALVAGNGPLTLALAQPGTDGVDFRSRESSPTTTRPELIVRFGS